MREGTRNRDDPALSCGPPTIGCLAYPSLQSPLSRARGGNKLAAPETRRVTSSAEAPSSFTVPQRGIRKEESDHQMA